MAIERFFVRPSKASDDAGGKSFRHYQAAVDYAKEAAARSIPPQEYEIFGLVAKTLTEPAKAEVRKVDEALQVTMDQSLSKER